MKKLKTLRNFLQERPLYVILWKIYCRAFNIKIPEFKTWKNIVRNKSGLEIGGPSGIFASEGFMPLYSHIKSLDGVNFSTTTIWEGELKEGEYFKFEGKTGFQFIAEGTDLSPINDSSYDFILSSNNLEHIANPLKALFEWKRVIKTGGIIILILPRKESNFDHKRAITEFAHIVDDFANKVTEDDSTHLLEIFQLHDLRRDPQAGSFENFKNRASNIYQTRSVHHHVFDINLLQQMIKYVGMKKILSHTSPTEHIIAAIK